jgi:Zn-dependent protease with chaperone function
MRAVAARYYNGKSSQERDVSIHAEAPAHLRIIGDGIDFSHALVDVRPSSRIGNMARQLYFPDGSQCETDDNDAIDELFAGRRAEAPGRLLHRWESRVRYVAVAFVLTSVLLWAGIGYGIPALAKQIAFSLSPSTDTMLSEEALGGLDKVLLEPTQLTPKRQAEVKALFSDMTANIDGAGGYRLELRASKKIGANALALPSGIVVVTDPLVELATGDGELTAVLAHEIGHLRQRHDLRRLLQGSATAVLVIAVTGDMSSVASLAAALPTLLVDSKYSRDFEREADDFAYDYLRRRGIRSEVFSEILLRMEKQEGRAGGVPGFLSSHPASPERAERFRSPR